MTGWHSSDTLPLVFVCDANVSISISAHISIHANVSISISANISIHANISANVIINT